MVLNERVRSPHKQAVSRRWAMVTGLVVMSGLALVLMFMLTLATGNRTLYEENFAWLAMVNLAVAVLLLSVILWLLVRLARRWRQGKFGSRLLAKLAVIFALVGFVPGLLIYTVSYQFVSRSIESWFDVEVEGALTAGLNLGRTALEQNRFDDARVHFQVARALFLAGGAS